MKVILILSILFNFCFIDVHAMEYSGKSYVVMEKSSMQVIESNDMHYVQSVASISKMMTCIVAIENQSLDTMIVVDEIVNEAWGSGIYVHIGDEISLKDLLYGLMLRSGNDGAMVIAKSVGKEVETFVSMMNDKALELGMNNTSFSNPTGLDEEDDGNRSSAYDMALLMQYCSQNPIYNEIINTQKYTRDDGNGVWTNKNKLLFNYEYCVGGKTGYTTEAKRTLVSIASKDGIELIIVTLNCGNDFEFHQSTYERLFEQYDSVKVLDKGIIDIAGKKFILDLDLYLDCMDEDEVVMMLEDDVVSVVKNKQVILEKTLQEYTILNGMKMVLRDLLYG